MAERQAWLYGGPRDGVHCRFFISSGRCPNPVHCQLFHPRPVESLALIIPHLFQGHLLASENEFWNYYEDFCIDLVGLLNSLPSVVVKNMYICSNLTNELLGAVYIQFETTAQAAIALDRINQLQLYGVINREAELSSQVIIEDALCNFGHGCRFFPRCLNAHAYPMQPNLRMLLGLRNFDQ